MPKLSYAQEIADLEGLVAAARSVADRLPPLALTVAGQIETQIATLKELKKRQRAYVAEQKVTTEALHAVIARGTVAARDIRAYVVLVYGTKHGRLTQFGIQVRRRPRRKAAEAPSPTRDAARTPCVAAANTHDERATVQEIGADSGRVRGEAGQIGGNTSEPWGNPFGAWGTASPVGGFPDRAPQSMSKKKEGASSSRFVFGLWKEGESSSPSSMKLGKAGGSRSLFPETQS